MSPTDRSRWSPQEVLAYIGEPYFAPGEGWHYSNTNYLLIGVILEQLTGSGLSAEFRQRFWEPLGIEGYLSIQEEIPIDRMAHVFGDDFHYGDREKDLTFEPRASHESIIFGSGGLFMTAEDLARWSQALFTGWVLSQESLDEVFRFVSFQRVANMQAYGLGVHLFESRFASGERAIGHGGGNIGSATYMVYLPEHKLSVVAMVNAFPTTCADVVAKGLIKVMLRDMGMLGWMPYIPFFPSGLLLCLGSIGIVVAAVSRWRRSRVA